MQISGSPSLGPLEAVPPTASWGRCGVGVLSRRLSGAGCFHSLALQHSSLHSLAQEVSYSAACVCSLLPRLPPCAFAAPLLPQTRSARSEGDMGFLPVPEASGQRWGPVLLAFFLAASQGLVTAFKVATPYSLYVCPEGQNVTLTCRILGPIAKGHDVAFYKTWFRSVRGEVQACSSRRPIRNLTFQNLHLHHGSHQAANTSQDLVRHHGLESISDHHGNFSITMLNLTLLDSGLYCCLVVEIKHHHSDQKVHGAMELQVQRGEEAPSKCIAYPASPRESESITAAALATGACIVGILCLPLILLLVYKQRQVTSNRRAQELVRMDSGNAQGLDNPGYEVSPSPHGMPEAKPRPPLSYVAQRQPSESGRHLLSEPNTPLSPPGPGDVFFPSLDPVPDSPNSEAV